MKNPKIKELLDRLNELDRKSGGALSAGDNQVAQMVQKVINEEALDLKNQVRERPTVKAVTEMAKEFDRFKKDIDVKGIMSAVKSVDQQNQTNLVEITRAFKEQLTNLVSEMKQAEKRGYQTTLDTAKKVLAKFEKAQIGYMSDKEMLSNRQALVSAEISRLSQELNRVDQMLGTKKDNKVDGTLVKNTEDVKKALQGVKEVKDLIAEFQRNFVSRLSTLQHGGGNMNRNIAIGGNQSVLSQFTDINFKAGNNVSLSYAVNQATGFVDVTIAATGGGGSVGGIIRSVNNINTSQTAGSVAGTDYVYIASAGIALTLPSASGIENLYTIKNTGTSSVLVAPDGADTIDTDANIILATQYTSVDLISDGTSNWNIT